MQYTFLQFKRAALLLSDALCFYDKYNWFSEDIGQHYSRLQKYTQHWKLTLEKKKTKEPLNLEWYEMEAKTEFFKTSLVS